MPHQSASNLGQCPSVSFQFGPESFHSNIPASKKLAIAGGQHGGCSMNEWYTSWRSHLEWCRRMDCIQTWHISVEKTEKFIYNIFKSWYPLTFSGNQLYQRRKCPNCQKKQLRPLFFQSILFNEKLGALCDLITLGASIYSPNWRLTVKSSDLAEFLFSELVSG